MVSQSHCVHVWDIYHISVFLQLLTKAKSPKGKMGLKKVREWWGIDRSLWHGTNNSLTQCISKIGEKKTVGAWHQCFVRMDFINYKALFKYRLFIITWQKCNPLLGSKWHQPCPITSPKPTMARIVRGKKNNRKDACLPLNPWYHLWTWAPISSSIRNERHPEGCLP